MQTNFKSVLGALLCTAGSTIVADAATITLSFSGTVSEVSASGAGVVPTVGVGTAVSGRFIYDDTLVTTSGSNPRQLYNFTPGQATVSVVIAGETYSASNNVFVRVANDSPQFSFQPPDDTIFVVGSSATASDFPISLGSNNISLTFNDGIPPFTFLSSSSLPLQRDHLDLNAVVGSGQILTSSRFLQDNASIGFVMDPSSIQFSRGFDVPTPQIVSFGDTALFGDISNFDLNKPTVVVTHGWQPGGEYTGGEGVPFLDDMYTAVTTQFNQDANPDNNVNVLVFTWEAAFTDPISLETAIRPLPYASDAGVILGDALAEVMGDEYSLPVHMIGHSYGAVVNVSAASELRVNGINTAHMTVLDAPTRFTIPTGMFTLAGESQWIDYLENYYGTEPVRVLGVPLAVLGESIPGAQKDGGYPYATDHEGVATAYLATVTDSDCSSMGGFLYSAALRNAGCFSDRPGQESDFITNMSEALLIPQLLQNASYDTANSTALISTGSDGFAIFGLDVPVGAGMFSFALQFLEVGDGDWLEVLYGDTLLGAYQGATLGNVSRTFLFDFSEFGGTSNSLTFLLAGSGPLRAQVSVSNFQFVSVEEARLATVPLPASALMLFIAFCLLCALRFRKFRLYSTV